MPRNLTFFLFSDHVMVRAGKLKSGAAKKVNRWSSSSSSNAKSSRFRHSAMAKKGLIKPADNSDKKSGGLTTDRLRLLDRMTGVNPDEDIPIDEVDLGSEASAATFKTFVSGVSDCTVRFVWGSVSSSLFFRI